jgi:hypothetical protein
MLRQDHLDVALNDVPGDLVAASASSLDLDITLTNAEFQLDRVAAKWADHKKRDAANVDQEERSGRRMGLARRQRGRLARPKVSRRCAIGRHPRLDYITALQVRGQAVHEAGSDDGVALDLGRKRSQKIVPLQRMDRPRRLHHGGVFVIAETERHRRRESGPGSAATMTPRACDFKRGVRSLHRRP